MVVQNSKDSKREIMVALSGKIPMPPSTVLSTLFSEEFDKRHCLWLVLYKAILSHLHLGCCFGSYSSQQSEILLSFSSSIMD